MGMQGDFFQLLKEQGYVFGVPGQVGAGQDLTVATTILAFKYRDGVLVAGDRRATAGNMVMYDRTDKVLEIDRHSVMAIAGVPATAYEMARILEHSFKYYRRTQLQELSFEGKLRALSKLLKDNVRGGAWPGLEPWCRSLLGTILGKKQRKSTFTIFSARSSREWSMPYPVPAHRRFEEFFTTEYLG